MNTFLTVPELRPHLEAVKFCLETGAAGRWRVGVGQAPGGAAPYMTVHTISDGVNGGPVDDPWADFTLVVQVTCVAQTELEAAWLRDQASTRMLRAVLAVPGRQQFTVAPRNQGQPIRRDDTVAPSLFYAVPAFTLTTVPL